MAKATDKQWNEFVKAVIDTESETSNVKGEFVAISKKHGAAYIDYLKSAWICNKDFMSEEEFCRINGNVLKSFFENKIKNCETEFEVESDSENTTWYVEK